MLAIIVPYRNRPDQLAQFIPHMYGRLHKADDIIIIVEQADEKPFNRGKLINIGFLESEKKQFVAHDVDMLPAIADYRCPPYQTVVQLAKSDIQKVGYLGGVTMFDPVEFNYFGGYHNDYFHRAEDNELSFHLQRMGIPVYNRFLDFDVLPHPRTGPEFIPQLWQKAQLPRTKNMLNTCEYKLISKEVHDTHVHLKVTL